MKYLIHVRSINVCQFIHSALSQKTAIFIHVAQLQEYFRVWTDNRYESSIFCMLIYSWNWIQLIYSILETFVLWNSDTLTCEAVSFNRNRYTFVGFKVTVFWVIVPCSPVYFHQSFHHQGDECVPHLSSWEAPISVGAVPSNPPKQSIL